MSNIYDAHTLATDGVFWKCRHGKNGYDKSMKWVGCFRCAIYRPKRAIECWMRVKLGKQILHVKWGRS